MSQENQSQSQLDKLTRALLALKSLILSSVRADAETRARVREIADGDVLAHADEIIDYADSIYDRAETENDRFRRELEEEWR